MSCVRETTNVYCLWTSLNTKSLWEHPQNGITTLYVSKRAKFIATHHRRYRVIYTETTAYYSMTQNGAIIGISYITSLDDVML